MTKFDVLNRETHDHNNGITRRIDPTSGTRYGTGEFWRNYWNNKTYKTNNGQFTKRYF